MYLSTVEKRQFRINSPIRIQDLVTVEAACPFNQNLHFSLFRLPNLSFPYFILQGSSWAASFSFSYWVPICDTFYMVFVHSRTKGIVFLLCIGGYLYLLVFYSSLLSQGLLLYLIL